MYRALYRKWRPRTFGDVVGQTDITTALQNQLLHDKIGHAYLFTGTRGTGKTTCARIFARAVNCQNRSGAEPCGRCPVCTGLEDGAVTDVVEIDAASNSGVENIRDLRDETMYTPSLCTYKVYIIDEVHMLSTPAFNALLKIMEEPPPHVIFILATTEIHKVPATILSRCQRYDFARIEPETIARRLLYVAGEEGIALEESAARLIARLADGAMRDALSILDTCAGVTDTVDAALVRRMAGVTDQGYLFELAQTVDAQDAAGALRLVAELREKGVDMRRLCSELMLHYRNLMLAGLPGGRRLLTGVSPEDEERYAAQAPGLPPRRAMHAIQALCGALDRMGKGTDARMELEIALFRLCEPERQAAPPAAFGSSGVLPPAPPAVPQPFAAAPDSAQAAPQPFAGAPQAPGALQTAPQPLAPAPDSGAAPPAAAPQPPRPFDGWDKVVALMEARDQLLYVNLRNSKAYCDGRRVLIDGSELFLDYMRKNEYSAQLLKQAIAEVSGVRYGIGPYRRKAQSGPQPSAEETLQRLAQQGVEVVYENE